MSTEYPLLKRGQVELELWEHSGLLDLATLTGPADEQVPHVAFPDMTPEQVVGVALTMLKVASYQIDLDDFRAAVAAAIKADPYGIGPICADVGDVARKGG